MTPPITRRMSARLSETSESPDGAVLAVQSKPAIASSRRGKQPSDPPQAETGRAEEVQRNEQVPPARRGRPCKQVAERPAQQAQATERPARQARAVVTVTEEV